MKPVVLAFVMMSSLITYAEPNIDESHCLENYYCKQCLPGAQANADFFLKMNFDPSCVGQPKTLTEFSAPSPNLRIYRFDLTCGNGQKTRVGAYLNANCEYAGE